MSFSSGSKTTNLTTNQSGQVDPWDETLPYLKDFLSKLGSSGGTGLTADQKAAFEYLKNNAAQGNPWDVEQAKLANDLYATTDRTGQVADAYKTLQSNIGDYASGKHLDPTQNPQLMKLLQQVGDDVANRTNAQFAAAGRDLSGANQGAVAKGVTSATAPILVDQYNKAQQQQIDAAGQLYGAGTGSAATQAQLDAARAALRGQGSGAGDKALSMQNAGANDILQLDQQIKMMPYEDLAKLASILFPAAQLGNQTQGTTRGTSTTDITGFSLGLGDVAKVGGAIGSMLSDERAKDGIEEIGAMADGQKLYRWRYKDDPTKTIHVGPIAQEVERKVPGAVHDDGPGGLKTVNMDAATRKAADIIRKRRGE